MERKTIGWGRRPQPIPYMFQIIGEGRVEHDRNQSGSLRKGLQQRPYSTDPLRRTRNWDTDPGWISSLRKGMFHANFSITAPEIVVSPKNSG